MKKIKSLLFSLVLFVGVLGAGNVFASDITENEGDWVDESVGTVHYKVKLNEKGSDKWVGLTLHTTVGPKGEVADRTGWVAAAPAEAPIEWNGWDRKHKAMVEEGKDSWTFYAWRSAPKDGDDAVAATVFTVHASALEAPAEAEDDAAAPAAVVEDAAPAAVVDDE